MLTRNFKQGRRKKKSQMLDLLIGYSGDASLVRIYLNRDVKEIFKKANQAVIWKKSVPYREKSKQKVPEKGMLMSLKHSKELGKVGVE